MILLVFIVTHLRPLSEKEIKILADKRRRKSIYIYFDYKKEPSSVNNDFKKKMKSKGCFYRVDELLFNFPSLVGGLLKYKKHEWIIVAFEKDKQIEYFWTNKGYDNMSASIYLSVDDMVKMAKSNKYGSILIFHNHPADNPQYYFKYLTPSEKDILHTVETAKILNNHDINLLDFTCERGFLHRYNLSPFNNFYPIIDFIKAIKKINNTSKLKNLSLHTERIFSKNIKY